MQQLTLAPVKRVEGSVVLPGSKSLTNRALLLAALAQGKSTLTNILLSDDTHYMLSALRQLGVGFRLDKEQKRCEINGIAGSFVAKQKEELYLGNAGTAMRPLAAVLALSRGEYILTGEPRMKERPIAHLVDALRTLGADIEYPENEGYPPIHIKPSSPKGGGVGIEGGLSSQYLTALLMASPLLPAPTTINIIGELVSKPYIDITLDLMRRFGVSVTHDHYQRFCIDSPISYQAVDEYMVEGDATSASYFLAAAAIKGGCVKVYGIDGKSVQGDIAFAYVLEKMGAKVRWSKSYIEVCRGELNGIEMDFNHIPDAAMTIATAALFANGTTVLRNIYNWRIKETDRLHAMATELQKVGAKVEEGKDYLKITPPKQIKHAQIDTYNDHRMAMSFSLLALSDAGVTINDPGCTSKTYPEYFEHFKKITHR